MAEPSSAIAPRYSSRGRLAMVIAAVVLVVIAVGFLGSESAKRSGFLEPLSTHNAAPRGAKALYQLCERAGLSPEHLVHNLEVIPEKGTIVSLEPGANAPSLLKAIFRSKVFNKDERDAIVRWVEEGGVFILAGREHDDEFLAAFGLEAVEPPESTQDESASLEGEPEGEPSQENVARQARELSQEQRVEPGRHYAYAEKTTHWPPALESARAPLAEVLGVRGLEEVRVERRVPGLQLQSLYDEDVMRATHGFVPLLTAEDGRHIAVEIQRGQGRLIVLSSSYLATNDGLGKADNGVFLLQLLAPSASVQDGGLYFDEYHHGFSNERSLSGYLRQSGLWIVVCQLAWLLFLVGWRLRRRFGAPLPYYEEELRGTADALRAMSQMYQRGGHVDHALGLMLGDLERAAAQHFRFEAGLTGAQTVARLESLRRSKEAEQLRRFQVRAADLSHENTKARTRDICALAREIAALTEVWRHGNASEDTQEL